MKIIACCFIAISLAPLFIHAQEINADSLGIRYINFQRAADKEEVHLETDRNIYAAGEKIWFTALLLDSLNKKIDTTSKNLFVDLVTDNDSVVNRTVLDAVILHTSGALTLSDSIPTGHYWLRCYTQNIITNSPASASVKPLYIVNRRSSSVAATPPAKLQGNINPVIHFFAEGGAFISGVVSTGALQVTDGDGNPLMATGIVKTDNDSIVATFTTNRFGLAKISFYPVWFKKYTATVNCNGKDTKMPLPAYNGYATQLAIENRSTNNITVHVALEDSIYSRRFATCLLAVNKDHVYFASVGHGMYTVDVPAAQLPGGITTLLLFNDHQQLISERKIFINKQNYNINTKTDKQVYTQRDNVRLDIDLTDGDGKPIPASINVAVQDNRIMQVDDNIATDVSLPATAKLEDWLKSNNSKLSPEDIDLLMLAQPQNSKDLPVANTAKKQQPDDNTLLLNIVGTITNKQKQGLAGKVVTAASLTKVNPYFNTDTTAADGSFIIPLPGDSRSSEIQLQVTGKRNIAEPDDYIVVNSFKFPAFVTPAVLKKQLSTINTITVLQLQKYTTDTFYNYIGKGWLKPVTVTAKAKREPDFNAGKRLSPFSHILTSEAFGKGGSGIVGNALLRVPGLSFINGKVVARGGAGGINSAVSEPLLVIDGVPWDADTSSGTGIMGQLNQLDYTTIDFIEVLEGAEAAIYGSRGSNGVVSVVTKYPESDFRPGLKVIKPVTYQIAPAFAMPNYVDKNVKADRSPDPRTTIFWKGNLITTKDGKAGVTFFTADEAGTYTIIVTGITQNGEYIYKRMNISVK